MKRPKIAPMCATSAMGLIACLREDLQEAEAWNDGARAIVVSGQIKELQELLDEGYFPPEQDPEELGTLPARVPPSGVSLILRLTTPRERLEDILGDMAERYALDCERFGERQAKWLAYADAVKSAAPLLWLLITWLFRGGPS